VLAGTDPERALAVMPAATGGVDRRKELSNGRVAPSYALRTVAPLVIGCAGIQPACNVFSLR